MTSATAQRLLHDDVSENKLRSIIIDAAWTPGIGINHAMHAEDAVYPTARFPPKTACRTDVIWQSKQLFMTGHKMAAALKVYYACCNITTITETAMSVRSIVNKHKTSCREVLERGPT